MSRWKRCPLEKAKKCPNAALDNVWKLDANFICPSKDSKCQATCLDELEDAEKPEKRWVKCPVSKAGRCERAEEGKIWCQQGNYDCPANDKQCRYDLEEVKSPFTKYKVAVVLSAIAVVVALLWLKRDVPPPPTITLRISAPSFLAADLAIPLVQAFLENSGKREVKVGNEVSGRTQITYADGSKDSARKVVEVHTLDNFSEERFATADPLLEEDPSHVPQMWLLPVNLRTAPYPSESVVESIVGIDALVPVTSSGESDKTIKPELLNDLIAGKIEAAEIPLPWLKRLHLPDKAAPNHELLRMIADGMIDPKITVRRAAGGDSDMLTALQADREGMGLVALRHVKDDSLFSLMLDKQLLKSGRPDPFILCTDGYPLCYAVRLCRDKKAESGTVLDFENFVQTNLGRETVAGTGFMPLSHEPRIIDAKDEKLAGVGSKEDALRIWQLPAVIFPAKAGSSEAISSFSMAQLESIPGIIKRLNLTKSRLLSLYHAGSNDQPSLSADWQAKVDRLLTLKYPTLQDAARLGSGLKSDSAQNLHADGKVELWLFDLNLPEKGAPMFKLAVPVEWVDDLAIPLAKSFLAARFPSSKLDFSIATAPDGKGKLLTCSFEGKKETPTASIEISSIEATAKNRLEEKAPDVELTPVSMASGKSAAQFVEVIVAKDAFAIISHPNYAGKDVSLADARNLANSASRLESIKKFAVPSPAYVSSSTAARLFGSLKRSESSETAVEPADSFQMIKEAVAVDKSRIGIVPMRYSKDRAMVKSLDLTIGQKGNLGGRNLSVSAFSVATGDYPFAFDVYLRRPAETTNKEAVAFATFVADTEQGQATIEAAGFVDMMLRPQERPMPEPYCRALGELAESLVATWQIPVAFHFESNRASNASADTLDDQSEDALKRLVDIFKKQENRDKIILLFGFADSVPGPDNLKLSIERASSIKSIIANELKVPLMTKAAGFGDQFPIDSNESEEGRQRNRRVEIWLAKTKK